MRVPAAEPFSPDLLRVIGRAVNPRHGLVTGLFEQPHTSPDDQLNVIHAVVAQPTYFRANAFSTVQTIDTGSGAGFSREAACWGAIGEAIERYAASIYWPDQIVISTATQLGKGALNLLPVIGIRHDHATNFDTHAKRGWLKGVRLTDRGDIFVPAAMCILGYESTVGPQEILGQNDSTGLACGRDFEDASLRALCEVIERDVFASNWLLDRAPPRITFSDEDSIDFEPGVRRALLSERLTVKVYHLSTIYGVHVVLGYAEHRQSKIGVVGAAASPDLQRAIEKAVAEVLHGWSAARFLLDTPPIASMAELRNCTDHVRYYLDPERFGVVRRLTRNPETVSYRSIAKGDTNISATNIAEALAADGFIAIAADLTTPDVADLGLTVVKVLVPGLQPLVFGKYCVDVPDDRRLEQWRKIWGVDTAPVNPHPHPFP